MEKEWRVNAPNHSKNFEYLKDARKYKKEIKDRLPDDAMVTIERREDIEHGHMWVPYE